MSVVFGGKLLSQKGQSAVDDYDDPNYGIKLLSKREKALLAELDRTRSEIVSELFTLGPSVSTENLDDWHNTINTYESQIHGSGSFSNTTSTYNSHKINKKRRTRSQPVSGKLRALKGSSTSFHESKTVTALDFLPALSTNSAASLGSSARKGGNSSQTIKLPVLSLPSIRDKSSNSNSPRGLDKSSTYNPLSDFEEFSTTDLIAGRALIVLGDLDRYYIQQYLEISNEQMDEILQDQDAILAGGISTEKGDRSSSYPSVFNAVKDVDFYGVLNNSTQSASSPHISTGNNMGEDVDTLPLADSNESLSGSSSLGFSRSSKLRKTNKNKNKSRHNKELTQKNRKAKMAWPESGVNDLNSLEALRSELVKSLGNMQNHTAQVREKLKFGL